MNRDQLVRLTEARMDTSLFRSAASAMTRHDAFPDTLPGMAVTGLEAVFDDEGDEGDELPSDRDFIAMLAAYRASGGIVRTDDLARMLNDRRRAGLDSLASLIGSGTVFGFEWRRAFWLPMFQFEPRDLSLKPAPRQVVAELAEDFDGWALAVWFAHANSWLQDRRPVDLLDSQMNRVLEAARADRFVASG